MTQPWGDHFQHSKAMFDFVHKTNMHQPPPSGGKLCMNYFKENKLKSPLEAQINGWICVLAHWPSPNPSREMHPMLKCCSGPLEWFAQKIVG